MHDGALALRLGQDVFQVGDLGLDLGQVVDDPLAFQGGQAPQLHVEDRLGLDVIDVEQLDQTLAGDVDGLRRPDEGDHLVERVERLDQAAQDVGAFIGLAQPVGGAPHDDVELVVDIVADHLVEPQRARYTVDDREHVGAEAGLQLGVLVEVVQHHLRDGVALELDHDPDADPVTALVLDIGDACELAVADLLSDRGDEVVVVDLVRQLGDDDAGAAARVFLDLHHSAHPDRAAARGVRVVYPLRADDQAGGGEVGSLHAFGDRRQRGLLVGLVVLQAPVHCLGELAQVVRWNVGGHADRDATRAVGQQVREPARQNRGFLHTPVVVRDEIDCLLIDFTQHLHRQRRETRLRVAHRGGWIVARRAEVALPVDERVAQRPRLRHPHQGVVDRRVAVRVVVTHGLGHRARRLGVAAVGPESRIEHRVEHPAVHGLEAVAHFRQRAPDDNAHRVVDVAALHLLLDVDRLDAISCFAARWQRGVSHSIRSFRSSTCLMLGR